MKRITLLTSILLVLSYSVFAQVVDPVKWKNKSKNVEQGVAEIIFEANIDMNWHLYSQYFEEGGPVRTTFYFDESDKFELIGTPTESPEPEEVMDEVFNMKVKYFSHNATFVQKIKLLTAESFTITGSIEYQVCQEDKCVYFNPDFKLRVKGTEPVAAAAKEALSPQVDLSDNNADNEAPVEKKSLWGLFFMAIVFGFAGILTPCVFPMIPMTVSFFMQGESSKANTILKALIFGISVVLLYTLVGLIVSLTSAGADLTTVLSSSWVLNLIFFGLFIVFALSFFGLFEIVLPSGLANKADRQVDKGGLLASFFMAFTLVIVSFSCTGPIIGFLLVKAATGAVLEPVVVMFGFGLAFALPFTLLAIFPSLLKKLPKSGGWMNSVKVVFGFIILAFSMKFLSNIDQVYHFNILSRDVYLAIWIVIFFLMGMYLLGKIKFAHDTDLPHVGVFRLFVAIASFTFAVYLVPGLFGANLNAVSALIPSKTTQNFDLTKNTGTQLMLDSQKRTELCDEPKYGDILHLPHGLEGYFDLEQGMACAKKLNKPVLLDFKGHSCANCKKMENEVWSDPAVLQRLREDYIIIALYVDERTKLPESEWVTSKNDGKVKKTVGKKNADFQITKYGVNSQPYYVLVDTEGEMLTEPTGYEQDIEKFKNFLDKGIQEFEKK
ncbi:MAG: disulfide bond formation protein DsbD [Marinilabiliales bacterium]|nr:MAG: disulfide bond formation protein DsbD [Marinilabiliales bacterium]